MAFATCRALPEGAPDDRSTLAALGELGVSAEPALWDEPTVDWGRFDLVVLRSTWDYHRHFAPFLDWLERVSRLCPLLNPLEIVRANTHKAYLVELARKGHAVVPTEVVRRGSRVELASLLDSRGWRHGIVKPEVGANSEGLFRVDPENRSLAEEKWRQLLAEKDLLVQPFLKETQTRGERSIVFLDGEFSHAVEYRSVLDDPARTPRPFRPAAIDLRGASEILQELPSSLLYARLDYLASGEDGWLLGELELIEPELFLRADQDAPSRFARAIAARLPGGIP
ncbi:MAG: hypothetical protein L3K09_06395 [Thermoplasmata archaeon]|nr:hypothetical protein [Thermoplasmata archaeon]